MPSGETEFRPTSEQIPAQHLEYPGTQADMQPRPDSDLSNYKPAHKLAGKVAIITGGDSGIGRATAMAYAMEGADVAILYNIADEDAEETKRLVEEKGGRCLLIKADVRDYLSCQRAIDDTVEAYGKLNILVNNAAYQMAQEEIEDLSVEQFQQTMETNVYGYFYMVKAALPHLHEGDVIINTGSITGLTGKPHLIDYSTTKGAIHTLTKSLALNLAKRKIRVNCVVPGPVWTPLIPATMPAEQVEGFSSNNAFKRSAQPEELAPTYVYLAAEDSSFVTGALIEVTGGQLSS